MADEIDRANDQAEQNLAHELATHRRRSEIDRGINTDGDCSECGERIEAARLRALPFATRCTACQTAFERWRRNHR